jgi:hypothetical protein
MFGLLILLAIYGAYLYLLFRVVIFGIRKWRSEKIHLSTLLLLTLVAGALLYGNMVPRRHGKTGWPVRIPPAEFEPDNDEDAQVYQDSDQEKWDVKYAIPSLERSVYAYYFAIPINLMTSICGLIFVGYAAEYLTRKQELGTANRSPQTDVD